MKKIFKFILKSLLGIIIISIIAYLGFRVNEYFTGNKYVKYLKSNLQTSAPVEGDVSFDFGDDFVNNQFFMVGEIHEFHATPLIDFATFKYLNQNADLRTVITEMDPVQAYYVEQFLKDSTEIGLKEILKNWVVNIGTFSTEYRNDKWGKYKAYYKSLSNDKKFELYGIDVIADTLLLQKFLHEKLPEPSKDEIPINNKEIIKWTAANIPEVLKSIHFSSKDSLLLVNLAANCAIPTDSVEFRDYNMYKNFYRLYNQNHWENEKIYGAFGLGHTIQESTGTFAEMIKRKNLFQGKFVSLIPLYTRSHLTIQSNWLPGFMADKGKYTRLSYGFDNIWLYYIRGIEDFKRVSPKNSINIFKLNSENSPYLNSARGLKSFSILPFIPKIPLDKNKSVTDYAQYIIYVDGSDWVKPDEE